MSLLLEALKRAEDDARKRKVFAESVAAPLDGVEDDQSDLAVQGSRVVSRGRPSRPGALAAEPAEPAQPKAPTDAFPDLYFAELSLVADDPPPAPAVEAAVPPPPASPPPPAPTPASIPVPVTAPVAVPVAARSPEQPAPPMAPPTPRQAKAAVNAMMAGGASAQPARFARFARNRRTVLLGLVAVLLLVPLVFLFLWDNTLTQPAPVAMGRVPPAAAVVAPVAPAVTDPASAPAVAAASAAVPVVAEQATTTAVATAKPRNVARPPLRPLIAAPVRRADTVANASAPAPRASAPTRNATQLTVTSGADRFTPMLAAAYASFQTGKLDAAEAAYRDVIKADPTQRDAWLGLAVIAHAGDRRSEAAEAYQQVLRLDPRNGTALTGLNNLDRSTNGPTEESRLRELLVAQPQSADLNHGLGLLMAAEQRWAEAQPLFFKAHSVAPVEPQYAFNLAVALDRMHKPDLAKQYYRTALQLAQQRRAGFDVPAAQARLKALTETAPPKSP